MPADIRIHQSTVLVSIDTAAAVLGVIPDTVRERIDAGELIAVDIASSEFRRELRVWVQTLVTRCPPYGADPRRAIEQCVHDLYRGRERVSMPEIGRRCCVDRSMVHRWLASRALVADSGGITRASWCSFLARRIQGFPPSDSVAPIHARLATASQNVGC